MTQTNDNAQTNRPVFRVHLVEPTENSTDAEARKSRWVEAGAFFASKNDAYFNFSPAMPGEALAGYLTAGWRISLEEIAVAEAQREERKASSGKQAA
jgi:hypothetical protein